MLLLEIDCDLDKMDNTSHLYVCTILIYLSDSLFIYLCVLSGYDYDA